MSGRWPFRTGMQHFGTVAPGSEAHLPTEAEGVQSMAEMLKAQGYETHAIGKWHLGYADWGYTPTGRGFDSHTGYFQGAIDYYSHTFSTAIGVRPGKKHVPKLSGLDFWRNRSAFEGTNGTYSVNYYEGAHKEILASYDGQ